VSRRLAVIGAGAAGLMAAIHARAAGADVTLLERTPDGGRKILISGGGRCNVLPARLQPERFVTDSPPALLRGMLRSWPLDDQRRFFEQELGLPLKLEDETGKLFPVSDRARDVRDALVGRARALGVDLRFSTVVQDVRPSHGRDRSAGGWALQASTGGCEVDRVIVATGGLSVPATGSEGSGLAVAAALGHVVHPTYAALTPLIASPPTHAALSGVSLPVRTRARDALRGAHAESQGGFLFTHRGYSGPAVLDVSHIAVRSRQHGDGAAQVLVHWGRLDRAGWERLLLEGRGQVANAISHEVPQRLADYLVDAAGVPRDRTVPQLRRAERQTLLSHLTAYPLPWTGDEGYRKAEVTGGGLALDEVEPATLESRRCQGLYFCGEVLDAFGPIGGHNFAWAWATGRLAGLGAAREADRRSFGSTE
jgi:predicted Rossmann fold flavoprotein